METAPNKISTQYSVKPPSPDLIPSPQTKGKKVWKIIGAVAATVVVIFGLLVWYGYKLENQNPQTKISEENVVNLDNVATVKIPDFVEDPLDTNLQTNWNDSNSLTYFWEGKTYTDFEGSGHTSPWHLIVSLYKNQEVMGDISSFLVNEASGFMWTKDNHQIYGPDIFVIGGGDTEGKVRVENQAKLFTPFSSKDGIDIETMDYPYTKYGTQEIIDTYIILVTDNNKNVRVLISVPKESYSLQNATDLAAQTSASINVDSFGLQQYFLNEVQKAQNLELLKPIALDIANKQVVTLPEFQNWKENNIQFETYVTASYDDTDPAYKPELLTVTFAVPKLNNYINIFVDTNKKIVLKVN